MSYNGLSKNQYYYRSGRYEVCKALTSRFGTKFCNEHFICFVCERFFHYLDLDIHHDDDLERGKGRGRNDRLAEWRKQLKSKNCNLMLLCKNCHRARHSRLAKIGARKQ